LSKKADKKWEFGTESSLGARNKDPVAGSRGVWLVQGFGILIKTSTYNEWGWERQRGNVLASAMSGLQIF
jgi:hypothetical protein